MAGAVSLYLKQNEAIVDTLTSNPLFTSLGVVKTDGYIDVELLRDALKGEINKAGFMRLSIPMIGDIDFTTDDVDTLYRFIIDADSTKPKPLTGVTAPNSTLLNTNGGVY